MPHVPRMLPVLISDPEMREKVSDTFTSQEFMDNLEGYFVDNIKVCKAELLQLKPHPFICMINCICNKKVGNRKN